MRWHLHFQNFVAYELWSLTRVFAHIPFYTFISSKCKTTLFMYNLTEMWRVSDRSWIITVLISTPISTLSDYNGRIRNTLSRIYSDAFQHCISVFFWSRRHWKTSNEARLIHYSTQFTQTCNVVHQAWWRLQYTNKVKLQDYQYSAIRFSVLQR